MNPLIGQSLIGAGSSVLGMIGQNIGRNKALNDQKGLMNQQMQNQMMLNQQGHNLQMDMWNKTNYGAQVEHMKKAGLNVGLMYGGGGAGGTTTGSQGGGSASGGNAPMPMDIGNMLMQGQEMAAKIKLLQAQTDNLDADTEKKKGVDTDEGYARINNLNANTGNTEADTVVKELQATSMEIENYIKDKTKEFSIETAEKLSEKLGEEAYSLKVKNYVDYNTANTAIAQQKADLATTYLEQKLMKENIKLTSEQTRKISQELAQGWEKLSLEVDRNNIEMSKTKIDLLKAKITKSLGESGLDLEKRGQDINAIVTLLGAGLIGRNLTGGLPQVKGFRR
jgi:membrane-associated HD superfamily phosphohydrolase